MQLEQPEICHFKKDGRKFVALTHMDVPGQEGCDIRIKNTSYGFTPSMWYEQRQSSIREPLEIQSCKLRLENTLRGRVLCLHEVPLGTLHLWQEPPKWPDAGAAAAQSQLLFCLPCLASSTFQVCLFFFLIDRNLVPNPYFVALISRVDPLLWSPQVLLQLMCFTRERHELKAHADLQTTEGSSYSQTIGHSE